MVLAILPLGRRLRIVARIWGRNTSFMRSPLSPRVRTSSALLQRERGNRRRGSIEDGPPDGGFLQAICAFVGREGVAVGEQTIAALKSATVDCRFFRPDGAGCNGSAAAYKTGSTADCRALVSCRRLVTDSRFRRSCMLNGQMFRLFAAQVDRTKSRVLVAGTISRGHPQNSPHFSQSDGPAD